MILTEAMNYENCSIGVSSFAKQDGCTFNIATKKPAYSSFPQLTSQEFLHKITSSPPLYI